MGGKKTPAPTSPDWEAIERDYRAGVKSLREIAAKDGRVTEGAIRKRAKRDGWERDLASKIKAKADALVRKAVVRKAGTQQMSPATEREVIDGNALEMANVDLAHRQGGARMRSLFVTLLTRMEATCDDEGRALIEQLAEMVDAPPPEGETPEEERKRADKRRRLLAKVIGLADQIDSAKKLTEVFEKFVRVEREIHGLGEKDKPPPNERDLTDEELQGKIEAINARLGYQRAG